MVHQHGDHHDIPADKKKVKAGAWLPADHRIHEEWLDRQIDHAKKEKKPLNPVLQEFKEFVENNTRVRMLFTQMFQEVPVKHPYNKDPTGRKQVRDFYHFLEILNHAYTSAPTWTDAAANVGMVGVPLCAILDYPMGTPSGYAAFIDPDVNKMLKKVLNEWGKFLLTPKSAEVLHTGKQGWFGEVGQKDIMEVANAPYQTSHKYACQKCSVLGERKIYELELIVFPIAGSRISSSVTPRLNTTATKAGTTTSLATSGTRFDPLPLPMTIT